MVWHFFRFRPLFLGQLRAGRARRREIRLKLEPLEDRTLPSISMATNPPSSPATQVWFSPDLNSDVLPLFQRPQDWQATRSLVNVLKLEQPDLINNPPSGTLNTWDRLRSAQMVQDLQAWNIALAFDTGVIKRQYVSNPNRAVQDAEAALGNVTAAGGHVKYLSMDEPYYGGVKYTTWSTEMIEDRASSFMQSIKSYDSSVQVGDVEPYPRFGVPTLRAFTDALIARGTTPAFFHLDIDFNTLNLDPNFSSRLNADLPVLRDYFAQKNIPFGVVFWAGGGTFNLDQDYAVPTLHNIDVVKTAMGVPVQSIFQSWVHDNAGNRNVPMNLPEAQPYTHAWVIDQGIQQLRGTTLAAGVPLSGGEATFSLSSPAVGNHTISASYGGKSNMTGSTGDDSASPQVVGQDSTTVAVTSYMASSTVAVASSPNPSLPGEAVVFTATASAAPPVTFNEGSTVLAARAPLSGDQPTITLSTLASGSHTIAAVHGGDGNFVGSTGDDSAVPQVVQTSTNTILASSPNSADFGQTATFTATVTASGAGAPSGAVTFQEGPATLAAFVSLDADGLATFSTSSLTVVATSTPMPATRRTRTAPPDWIGSVF
jgi:hypothetical protein